MSAYNCTGQRPRNMRKCYKGTLQSSRTPFHLIGTQKGTPSPAFLFCCPETTTQKGR
nr:MAG TPA: hypothetical protein [Caudoviricetes sp.]